jgi:uncharacterized cupin superfamily protein
MMSPEELELHEKPVPFPSEMVFKGRPESRSKTLAKSEDRNSYVMLWECTPGCFQWHYTRDETIVVLSGEAFLLSENGEERRFGAGDMGFFPAGTTCNWRVDDHFKKIAVMRDSIWPPLGYALKAWDKVCQVGRSISFKWLAQPVRVPKTAEVNATVER